MTYSEIIKKLKEERIIFAKGLEEDEFAKIESIYGFKFPKELKRFYSIGLPTAQHAKPRVDGDKGEYLYQFPFPLWNDFSEENIKAIKAWIYKPKERIVDEYKNDGTLLTDLFGQINFPVFKPEEYEKKFSKKEKENHLIELNRFLYSIEMLIPIFGHRYLVLSENKEQPILSCWGTDIIVYGSNLKDYLQCEFLNKKYNTDEFMKDANNSGGWRNFLVR